MTDAKREMHLAIQAAAPGHPAGWRVPGGERQAGDDVAHYQNVARICDRALLDVLFLADSSSFTDDGRSPTRYILSFDFASLKGTQLVSQTDKFSAPRPRPAAPLCGPGASRRCTGFLAVLGVDEGVVYWAPRNQSISGRVGRWSRPGVTTSQAPATSSGA